jgi:hypothetical protein
MYKTIILPAMLYEGCSLTVREEFRLRVFEDRILKRIFSSKKERTGIGECSTMRNFIACTVHLILSG